MNAKDINDFYPGSRKDSFFLEYLIIGRFYACLRHFASLTAQIIFDDSYGSKSRSQDSIIERRADQAVSVPARRNKHLQRGIVHSEMKAQNISVFLLL